MNKKYDVTYKVEIPFQRIADIMCGALEGGSTYWCDQCQIEWDSPEAKPDEIEWGHEAIAAGAPFMISHNDENELIPNSKARVEKALQVMADKYPEHFANFVGETDDAETSDVFFQTLCWAEIVYG